MGRFQDMVVLVTGAARGQGRNHALRFAEEGAHVIALDLCADIPTLEYELGSVGDLKETAAGVQRWDRRVVTAEVDVRDFQQMTTAVADAVEQLGRIDVVAANAGVCTAAPALTLSSAAWADVIDVNLTGAFNTAKATVPHILAHGGGGSVVFTASIGGLEPIANLAHYCASKFGLIGLMKTLALELGESGIRVNAVCPGNVDTTMMMNPALLSLFFPDVDGPGRADVEAPDSIVRQGNTIPVPFAEVDDVSNAVLHLASDAARYVTGTTLVVDAGRMLT